MGCVPRLPSILTRLGGLSMPASILAKMIQLPWWVVPSALLLVTGAVGIAAWFHSKKRRS